MRDHRDDSDGAIPKADNTAGAVPLPRVAGLIAEDWRSPAVAVARSPGKPTASPSASRPALHLKAKPGDWRAERSRAMAVVAEGAVAIEAAMAAATEGRAIDLRALTPIISAITASIARDPVAVPIVTRLKRRHEYTYIHSVAVCGLMIAFARQLNLDEAVVHEVGLAGLLHDIGKARIPNLVLDKAGALTSDEFRLVKSHTERGVEILSRTEGISPLVIDVCLNHHERIDGRGYPYGKTIDNLSLYARMAAICDVYDAVTSLRSYKRAWSAGEAIEWMTGSTGHFDRQLLSVFVPTLGAFPVGSLVRLDSQRLGVVAGDRPEVDPMNPVVRAFYCASTARRIAWRDVDTRHDRVMAVESAAAWGLEDWPAIRAAALGGPAAREI
ncbi:putative nucleotidyltransferase with HDIG domain [Sphingomonas sp. UYAg733]